MKKFKKLLTIIAAGMLILTGFVVSVAAEDVETKPNITMETEIIDEDEDGFVDIEADISKDLDEADILNNYELAKKDRSAEKAESDIQTRFQELFNERHLGKTNSAKIIKRLLLEEGFNEADIDIVLSNPAIDWVQQAIDWVKLMMTYHGFLPSKQDTFIQLTDMPDDLGGRAGGGFSKEDALDAIRIVDPNWAANALASAEYYKGLYPEDSRLNCQWFLEDELFYTIEEARAAADSVYGFAGYDLDNSSSGIIFEDKLKIEKNASVCEGCRKYEVALKIEGELQDGPVDAVIIIDRSGSMRGSRLTNARDAAKIFAEKTISIPGSRVSIISFSGSSSTLGYGAPGNAVTNIDFTSNLDDVKSAIDHDYGTGGTNTAAGFLKAEEVIKGGISMDNPNSHKVAVMLTDGLPTSSNYVLYEETTDFNHPHIQSAVAAGKSLADFATVFTIAITDGMNTEQIELANYLLDETQTMGYYNSPSSDNLNSIFEDISTKLNYLATSVLVKDKIGNKFNLVKDTDDNWLVSDNGDYNEDTREITWDLGIIKGPKKLTYTIQAKPEFDGGDAFTNEEASINYTDVSGKDKIKKGYHEGDTLLEDFEMPIVNVTSRVKVFPENKTITRGQSIDLGLQITVDGGTPYITKLPKYDIVWTLNGETLNSAVVSPTSSTTYDVEATDSKGCIGIARVVITVNKPYTPPVDPPTVDITGKKVWVDGPEVKPTVELQLYRNDEAVNGKVATLEDGKIEHTWRNLEEYASTGSKYVYTVKEVGVPENYTKVEDGLTVTNTYVSPKIDVTVNKVWIGEPEVKPTITLELYRDDIKVGSAAELMDGMTTYTWFDLDQTDNDGKDYVYTVKEVNMPDNYIKEEAGLTVTNTYVIPIIDITGMKIWIGGPEVKPDIELQLYRNDEVYGNPMTLVNGVVEYTWKDLKVTDEDGMAYKYTIREVEVPESYDMEISEDGLTITNTYFEELAGYVPEAEKPKPDTPKPDTSKPVVKPYVPSTGINSYEFFYTMTLLVSSAGLVVLGKRKKDED